VFDDEYYMREAIKIAKQGIGLNEFPFGCCLVTKDHVIKTANTCYSKKNALLHAEINAINEMIELEGRETLEDACLYATTEPCVMCMGGINWARIKRLVYGSSIMDSAAIGFHEIALDSNQIVSKFPYELDIKSGVLKEECDALYDEWIAKNKVLYRLMKRNVKTKINLKK